MKENEDISCEEEEIVKSGRKNKLLVYPGEEDCLCQDSKGENWRLNKSQRLKFLKLRL